jgi:outer membrane lipoprotein-sorting protein
LKALRKKSNSWKTARPSTIFCRIALVLLAAIIPAACATTTTTGPLNTDLPVILVDTAGDLYDLILEANPVYDTVRATSSVSVKSSDEDYEVTELVLGKRPGYLRLESLGPLGDTILFLTTDQKRVYIYSPFENRYYSGLASKKNLSLMIPIPFGATDIVELLQGRVDLNDYYPIQMTYDELKQSYTLTLMPRTTKRGRAVLTVDGRTFLILEMMLYDTSNNLILIGSFSRFEEIGERIVPTALSFEVPEGGSFLTVGVRHKEIRLDSYIEESRFELDPPRGVQEIDLDKSIIDFDRTPIK